MIAQYGWRVSFWMAGVATAVLAVVWLWYVRDHPFQHPAIACSDNVPLPEGVTLKGSKAGPTPWLRFLTDRNLMLLTGGYFAVSYFEYIYFFWLYYYLGEIRHLGPRQSAVATTIVFLTWMVMSPIGGWVSDLLVKRYGQKAGRRIVPIISLTLSAALLCVAINLTGTVATVAFLSLSFGFASISDGPYWAAAINLGGKQVGAACGILNTGGNFGGIAPYVAPTIAAYAGWSWGLYSGSMMLMAAVLTWFFIDPSKTIKDDLAVKGEVQATAL
jgi:sugar phosphate permease